MPDQYNIGTAMKLYTIDVPKSGCLKIIKLGMIAINKVIISNSKFLVNEEYHYKNISWKVEQGRPHTPCEIFFHEMKIGAHSNH